MSIAHSWMSDAELEKHHKDLFIALFGHLNEEQLKELEIKCREWFAPVAARIHEIKPTLVIDPNIKPEPVKYSPPKIFYCEYLK